MIPVIPDDCKTVSPPVTLTGCADVEDICDVCCAFWELSSFQSVPVTAVTVAVLASSGDAKDAAELDAILIGVMLEVDSDICASSTGSEVSVAGPWEEATLCGCD